MIWYRIYVTRPYALNYIFFPLKPTIGTTGNRFCIILITKVLNIWPAIITIQLMLLTIVTPQLELQAQDYTGLLLITYIWLVVILDPRGDDGRYGHALRPSVTGKLLITKHIQLHLTVRAGRKQKLKSV